MERRNAVILPEVERFRERQKYLKQIELIKKKVPWLEYDIARTNFHDAKNRVEACQELLAKADQSNVPLKKEIE